MDKIIQVNVFMAVLYLLYRIVFRYGITFLWNRIYLLLLIPISILIPFIPELFPRSGEMYSSQLPIFTVLGGEAVSTLIQLVNSGEEANTFRLVWFLYGIIALLILSYYALQHISLIYRLLSEKSTSQDGILLVKTNSFRQAFSYFNFLILPNKKLDKEEYNMIYLHEKTHIQQRHTFDLLFLQILSAVFWFNPISWLLIQEMKLVHEYLADKSVIRKNGVKKQYFDLLLKESLNFTQINVVNQFNYSPLKFRIMMMKRTDVSLISRFAYLLLVPVLLGMSGFVFGQNTTNAKAKKEVKTVKGVKMLKPGNEVFTIVDNPPEFPGGQSALMKFIGNKIEYPKGAIKEGVEGTVYVNFVVEKDGSITELSLARSVDSRLDKESIRVVKLMPKWNPGTQRGEKVRVKFTLPIAFKLDNKKEKKSTNRVDIKVEK